MRFVAVSSLRGEWMACLRACREAFAAEGYFLAHGHSLISMAYEALPRSCCTEYAAQFRPADLSVWLEIPGICPQSFARSGNVQDAHRLREIRRTRIGRQLRRHSCPLWQRKPDCVLRELIHFPAWSPCRMPGSSRSKARKRDDSSGHPLPAWNRQRAISGRFGYFPSYRYWTQRSWCPSRAR